MKKYNSYVMDNEKNKFTVFNKIFEDCKDIFACL